MLTLRRYPRRADRAGEYDPAPGPLGVLLPSPSLLGTHRAFHIDTLAGAIGAGPSLQLRDLVALPAAPSGLVHAIGLGDDHDARGKPSSALVRATPRHELQR